MPKKPNAVDFTAKLLKLPRNIKPIPIPTLDPATAKVIEPKKYEIKISDFVM
jgi:hypothetical protein